MQRHYGRLVASLTVTVATFFGAGVIVAMLYVGPQITAPGRPNPLVVHDYSFTDVALMGILFGLVSAIVCLTVLIPITRHDKRRCIALSKSLNVPLGQVFFLTQSCVVRKPWATRQDAFDESLAALKSLRVWLKVQDAKIGCIEAYTRPLFASRVTVKTDEVDGDWLVTAVSTPVSGLLILDFGRNFEIVNQFRQALASD
ncbi:MAG TPA: hypothetical protein VM163_05230 [bacterium]|nr:hypothetical protein [bacterium]